MTHTQALSLIRSDELQRFRSGDASIITLAGINHLERCQHDQSAIADCPNASCRWSGICSFGLDERRRRH